MLLLLACGPASIEIDAAPPRRSDSAGPVDTAPIDTARPELDPPTEPEALPGDTAPADSGPTDTGPTDDDLYEALFDPATIQTVDITLSEAAIAALNADGTSAYVEGDVVVNGMAFTDVGVRLKGSSTYEDLDCSDGYCKAAFKVRFNEFVPGQKYGDTERLTLNNMTSDYTQSKEVIAYDLLHRQSQLAPRASYARVTLNGAPMGLYSNVESMDDAWLERTFADPSGSFWGTAASWGDFSDTGLRMGWVLKSGAEDLRPLIRLKEALDAYGGDFFGEMGPYVSVDQWLDYWAWCAAIGNYDGYPFHLNDVLIYGDPTDDGRFVFLPWGADETWDVYESTGQTWNVVAGRLGTACLADPACVTELKVHIADATSAYDETDVAAMAQAAWDLSEDDVLTDPRRPFLPADVWAYRTYYATIIPTYGAYVRGLAGI